MMEIVDLARLFSGVIKKNPFHSLLFFIGITLSGYFQIVSLGALYPIINTITGSQGSSNKIIQYVERAIRFLGLEPNITNYFLIFLSVAFLSAMIYIVSETQQAAFLRKIEFNERFSLVKDAVYSNWAVLRDLNHGDFINTVTREVQLYKVVIKYLFVIISSFIQIICLIYMAILIDRNIALFSLGLLVLGGWVFYPLMKKANSLGREWTDGFSIMTDNLLNTTRAFKNIKTGSLESFLLSYIRGKISRVSFLYEKMQILSAIQSRLSELIGFITITIVFFVGRGPFNADYGKIILISVVLIRLVPQVRFITDSFHRAYSALPSFNKIQRLKNVCIPLASNRGSNIAKSLSTIGIKNLTYGYDGRESVIQDLTLEISKGEFWAVCGPTGAGKTTLLDLISSIIEPTSGEIWYDQLSHHKIGAKSLHRHIGYLTQDSFIFAGSILENIVWGETSAPDKNRLSWALRTAQLETMCQEKGLDFKVAESGQNLSGGQKQRIAIARTLMKNFDFILMDEPTSALDPKTEQDFIETISELKGKVGIVLVTHDPKVLEYCDHILEIGDGYTKQIR